MDDKRVGRPTKFNEKLSQKILELAEAGKTDDQIAEVIGVSRQTVCNWKGKYPDFLYALKECKQTADELVEASLFHRAVGYSHKATKMFQHEGAIITEDYQEHYPPDTTAAIFWLKNRQPVSWRDKSEVELSGKVDDISEIDLDKRIEEKMLKLKGVE